MWSFLLPSGEGHDCKDAGGRAKQEARAEKEEVKITIICSLSPHLNHFMSERVLPLEEDVHGTAVTPWNHMIPKLTAITLRDKKRTERLKTFQTSPPGFQGGYEIGITDKQFDCGLIQRSQRWLW
jgi:hypothetical protein